MGQSSISRKDIKEDDVVLIGSEHPAWTNCLMLVDDVRDWGVIGTVIGPHQAEYPLRVSFVEIIAVYRKQGVYSPN